jgi:nitric-oxide synthase
VSNTEPPHATQLFLQQMHREGLLLQWQQRWQEVASHAVYQPDTAELAFGARVAWRNATRCIGRLYWRGLEVQDLRQLSSETAIFEALVGHLVHSTNGGKIRPRISVFAPGVRIWNSQLLGYAGYSTSQGTVGDPKNLPFTRIVQSLGWPGGPGTPFDLLPLVIQLPERAPRWFEWPQEAVLEVALHHPQFDWFADLGLKWYALPAIADMAFELGSATFSAAPFSGWYMGTEIGARNLGDPQRYNQLPRLARAMGLDTSHERTLWRDTALVELNRAVLHSFEQAGVQILDHHTASQHFIAFEEQEKQAGRPTYGNWSWLVPPVSGSTSPIFHRDYTDIELSPRYVVQPPAFGNPV